VRFAHAYVFDAAAWYGQLPYEGKMMDETVKDGSAKLVYANE